MRPLMVLLLVQLNVMTVKAQTAKPADCCNPYPKTISVTGSAEMEVVPDEIYVNVTLKEYDKRGEGKITLETIKSGFLNACKEAGIADSNVAVASYEGYDRWYWKKRKKTPDLNASISYQVKFSNNSQMDALVDRLDDEATQNFFIASTSHSKITEYWKQLKINAVKAARDKGIYLTEAVGEKLGEAITIIEPSEQSNAVRMNTNVYSNAAGGYYEKDKADISTQTAYKKIRLRYEVNVLFALK
jgi:uncharacterized protein YggE